MAKQSVKDQVLNILLAHKGTYYSGQDLAEEIGVSRTAVWKAINTLRESGMPIEGSTKLGYAMSAEVDGLSQRAIVEMLSEKAASFYDVECVHETTSTNDIIRSYAMDARREGTCLVAECQSAGKGRRGRRFHSPDSTGLYLSILLRPELSMEDAVLITTAASVAGAKACESVNDSLKQNDVEIKWVNDLFLNDKKICGILTEAGFSMETHGLDYAVLGIGFNLLPPKEGWPEEIKEIAGSLFEENMPAGSRNKLAATFLEEFLSIYETLPAVEYLDEYRKRQLAIGRTVSVLSGKEEPKTAKVIDVDDRCQLVVVFDGDSEQTHLNSGEISVRL